MRTRVGLRRIRGSATLRAHCSRGRLIHRSGQCLEINTSINAGQRITQMINLSFPQLRGKEVVFDRRALLHLGYSNQLELPRILPERTKSKGFFEVPNCCSNSCLVGIFLMARLGVLLIRLAMHQTQYR